MKFLLVATCPVAIYFVRRTSNQHVFHSWSGQRSIHLKKKTNNTIAPVILRILGFFSSSFTRKIQLLHQLFGEKTQTNRRFPQGSNLSPSATTQLKSYTFFLMPKAHCGAIFFLQFLNLKCSAIFRVGFPYFDQHWREFPWPGACDLVGMKFAKGTWKPRML